MNTVFLLSFLGLAVNVAITKDISTAKIIKSRYGAKDWYLAELNNDAINFETQQVNLCGPIFCIGANLTKGSITGMTEYEIIKSDFSSDGTTFNIDIDINFPKLQLNADHYTMKGNVMEALPLSGEGKLHFETTDLRIWTRIIMQVTDHTSIQRFENSGFSIKSILSKTEFDGNIDDVFNAMVAELLPDHLNRFNKAIAAQCGSLLTQLINPILN